MTSDLEKFAKFCRLFGIELEPFQKKIMREVFAGRREVVVLIPRGNGKTSLLAAYVLFHLWTTQDACAIVAAATEKQAGLMREEAKKFIRAHTALAAEFHITIGRITCRKTNGWFETRASDRGGRLHGLIPSLVCLDELHSHHNSETYDALSTAMGKREGSQMLVISTAGMKRKGVLWDLREKAMTFPVIERSDCFLHVATETFALLEWSLPQDTDIGSLTGIDLKRANPASFVRESFLQEQLDSPGLRRAVVAAFHGNLWAKTEAAWLPEGAWAACEGEAFIPDGATVVLGLDIGVRKDSSAVVTLHRRDDGTIAVRSKVWTPEGHPVRLAEVEDYIRSEAKRFSVRGVAYDPWAAEGMAQTLSAEGILMVEVGMNNARMVPASGAAYEAINSKVVVHDGDPVLASHVLNGSVAYTERGWKISKNPDKDPVDALIAFVLGLTLIESAKESVYERRGLLVL